MTRRTRGREIALQVLYQSEQNSGFSTPEARRFIKRRLRSDPKLIEFTETLIDGVQQHQENLDEMISEAAENWRIDRMAAIDRNILRLGAYEMLFSDEVPSKVAINEALELAKRYSTAQSSRFVNGILDRLQAQSQAQAATPETAVADAEVSEAEAFVEPAVVEASEITETPANATQPQEPEAVPEPKVAETATEPDPTTEPAS